MPFLLRKKILIGALALNLSFSAFFYFPNYENNKIYLNSFALQDSENQCRISKTENADIYYTLKDGKATIIKYYFTSDNYIYEYAIPSEIEGYPVTELGEALFRNVEKVRGIIVPECVEKINSGAFYTNYNSSLNWVRFENSDIIFADDKYSVSPYLQIQGKLKSTAQIYAIKNHIYFVDYESIVHSDVLTGKINNGEITITGCEKNVEELVIPEEINGLPVTAIDYSAFFDLSNLKSVYIPDTVKSLGSYAFQNCKNLSEIRLPEGLSEIPDYCFSNCYSLASCKIPDTVMSFGKSAFNGCTSLESINIPPNVNHIGCYAFRYVPCIEKLADENNLLIISGFLIDGTAFEGENLIIPDGVTNICSYAFQNNQNIKEAVIPESVSVIEDYVFSGCINLESVKLPDSLTKLGIGSFTDCTSLSGIDIPDKISEIEYQCFKNCTALKRVKLPSELKEIIYNAFSNCTSLEEISLPDSLEIISSGAFANCTSIKSVKFPDTLKTIEHGAFYNCTSLSEIIFPDDKFIDIDYDCFRQTPWLDTKKSENELVIINNMILDGTQCSGDLVIPDGIIAVCGHAFKDSEITSVKIPDSVQKFGTGAFSGCKNLTEFTIPDGFTEIPSCMFSGCTSLKKVNIPESVTDIRSGAFMFCYGFTEFTVPKQIKSLSMAFEYCDNLKTITFENPDCLIASDSDNFFAMPINTVVRGYAGSSAYWFAYLSGRKFEPIFVSGDVNSDGSFTVSDLVMLEKWILNDETELIDWKAVDLDGNGIINVFDLCQAKKMLIAIEKNLR